jgi:GTP-binding protein
MADIPGLIEGSSQGKGLGIQFLKHIQRTRLIVYVIDVNEPDIQKTRGVLQTELSTFDRRLVTRPSLVVITKIDMITDGEVEELSQRLPDNYIYISALTGKNKNNLIRAIEEKLDQQRTERTTD